MSELSTRTTGIIAAEINSIKEQTRKLILNSSIEIGRRLVEAKSMLPHGEWGTWLKESVDYSQSTANNLMKIFEQYGANQLSLFGSEAKSQAFANLSYSQAVALLGVPEEEREQFIEENDVENMSTRELQQVIKEKQLLQRELEVREAEAMAAAEKAEQERKEREKFEQQYKDYELMVQRLQTQLEEAEGAGDQEEINNLKRELTKAQVGYTYAQDKITQLKEELAKKPKEVTKVIEKVPDEVERELTELRKKVSQQNNPGAIKFKLRFDSLVTNFRDLLESLGEIPESEREKYKAAVTQLFEKMSERL